jgi:hypothetical protein
MVVLAFIRILLREQEITKIPLIMFYSRIQVLGTPSPSLARQAARRLKMKKPSWGSAFPGLCRFLSCGMFVISDSLNRT